MAISFISLGTNLGNKPHNLALAIQKIALRAGEVAQKSSIYDTPPWGFSSFNNFLNQVVRVNTQLEPFELLHELLEIETEMGRQRQEEGYHDRIIDLDILFFDDLVIDEKGLVIPHPRLQERAFMLMPLAELAPEYVHPISHKTISDLAKALIAEWEG